MSISPSTSSTVILKFKVWGYNTNVLFRAEYTTVSYSLNGGQLVVSLYINHYLLQDETSQIRPENALIYECKDKNLGTSLLFYPFGRVIGLNSSLGSIICSQGLGLINDIRPMFHLIKLVSPIKLMTLSHQWAYLARPHMITVQRLHSWVRLLISFLSR